MATPITQTNKNEEWDGQTGQLISSEDVVVDVTEQVVEYTLHSDLRTALDGLRQIANSTGTLSPLQLSNAVRLEAKVLIGLGRMRLEMFDDTT